MLKRAVELSRCPRAAGPPLCRRSSSSSCPRGPSTQRREKRGQPASASPASATLQFFWHELAGGAVPAQGGGRTNWAPVAQSSRHPPRARSNPAPQAPVAAGPRSRAQEPARPEARRGHPLSATPQAKESSAPAAAPAGWLSSGNPNQPLHRSFHRYSEYRRHSGKKFTIVAPPEEKKCQAGR